MKKANDFEIIVGLIVLVGILVLFGIGIYSVVNNEMNRITEGTIIDKQISEGYTSADYHKESGGSYHEYPTEYFFQLEGEKNGETVRYWANVSAEDYNTFRVGDYYRK